MGKTTGLDKIDATIRKLIAGKSTPEARLIVLKELRAYLAGGLRRCNLEIQEQSALVGSDSAE